MFFNKNYLKKKYHFSQKFVSITRSYIRKSCRKNDHIIGPDSYSRFIASMQFHAVPRLKFLTTYRDRLKRDLLKANQTRERKKKPLNPSLNSSSSQKDIPTGSVELVFIKCWRNICQKYRYSPITVQEKWQRQFHFTSAREMYQKYKITKKLSSSINSYNYYTFDIDNISYIYEILSWISIG